MNGPGPHEDGWREYRMLVLSELERLTQEQEKILKALRKCEDQLLAYHVKASVFGAGAGVVITAIGYIFKVWE